MKQLHIFFNALAFLTRIQVPSWVAFNQSNLQASARYFPLIGFIIGGLSAAVFYLSAMGVGNHIAVLLSMVFSIYLTGAFHEDGWADCCDAFGGGYDKAQILSIMKDSRLGTYGVIGLILLLAIKYQSLAQLAQLDVRYVVIAYILAHTLSRFWAVSIMYAHTYVQDIDKSKSKPLANRMHLKDMLLSILIAILAIGSIAILFKTHIPNTLLWPTGLALFTSLCAKLYLAHYYRRQIGGYTGDCLGAIQQLSETVIYLAMVLGFTILT